MDFDRFEERAAIREFCGGQSRFAAETDAAAEQGLKRWEVMDAIRKRDFAGGGNHRQTLVGDGQDRLPGMQRQPQEQDRSMPQRDVQAGRDRMVLPPLRA